MLEDIGLFNERYGSYYEDAGLSWRACNRSGRSRFVPESIVLQRRGGTTKNNPKIERIMKVRNAMNVVETVRRHASLGQKLMVSLGCLFLAPFREAQKRLDRNDIGGDLYWKQFKRIWSLGPTTAY